MQLKKTVVLITPVLLLLLFSTSLVGIDRLAFRDVSHFYTPLYDYVAERNASQWLPLWNPLDQTGLPLLGETTTAVLYPVRMAVFALPVDSETAISWYIVLHLLLASFTAVAAARWHGISERGANFAGLLYPLSGSILFLYSNPPFLVSAAWLPLVIGAMLRQRLCLDRKTLFASLAMAMMILAGDPQTALHAMITVVAVWGVREVKKSKHEFSYSAFAFVPIFAALLTLPQLIASAHWSQQSDRVAEAESRAFEAYEYSLAPWHALEIVTPNAFGNPLPQNARLSRLIPGDGRTWTPSIYMSALALLVLATMLQKFRQTTWDCWSGIFLAGLVLSMGHFGLIWVWQAMTHTMLETNSAIGGPYWLLHDFLPGYSAFRYPTKWLPFVSLGAALMVAKRVDEDSFFQPLRSTVHWTLGIVSLCLAGSFWFRFHPRTLSESQPYTDSFWGPLNWSLGMEQIQISLTHSLVVLGGIAALLLMGRRREWPLSRLTFCLFLLIAVDLGVHASGMIARVSRSAEASLLAEQPDPNDSDKQRWLRTQNGGGWPAEWRKAGSANRLLEAEASSRAAWFGRWHLADREAVFNNMVSIRSRAMAEFWRASDQRTKSMTAPQREQYWQRVRRWLAIDGVLHTTSGSRKSMGMSLVDVVRLDSPTDGPEIRAHQRWSVGNNQSMNQSLEELDASDGLPIPNVHTATAMLPNSSSVGSDATVATIEVEADFAEFHLNASSSTLLSRPVFQDGCWRARYSDGVTSHSVQVHCVDHLQQGAILPAGEWTVRFEYAPWWLKLSLAVAGISWLTWICLWVRLPSKSRQHTA